MAVDKNLFLYDLAVVAIMKNEAPYIREWLDYHLLAGVNHFYIYDNEDSDVQKQILQPYIERGIVTHIPYSGKARQYQAYNDAVNDYRFFCRYMAFIDGDEFIFPQGNKGIVEVLDEILNEKYFAGLGVNWHCFGSNNHEKADYAHGVLERFTRRAPTDWLGADEKIGGNAHIKTIANPRKTELITNPHFAYYFAGYTAVSENASVIPLYYNNPPTADKIVINHYHTKSREEYEAKIRRGNADSEVVKCTPKQFLEHDHNEIFDDGILKYRAARRNVRPSEINYVGLCNALSENLATTLLKNVPQDFLTGKMETFLTCLKLAAVLREKIFDEATGKFFEAAALNAIEKTLSTALEIADIKLFFSELPNILSLHYPESENIRRRCVKLLPNVLEALRLSNMWRDYNSARHLLGMLKVFGE